MTLRRDSFINSGRIRHRQAGAVPNAQLLVITCPYAGLWGWTWGLRHPFREVPAGGVQAHRLQGNGCVRGTSGSRVEVSWHGSSP